MLTLVNTAPARGNRPIAQTASPCAMCWGIAPASSHRLVAMTRRMRRLAFYRYRGAADGAGEAAVVGDGAAGGDSGAAGGGARSKSNTPIRWSLTVVDSML